jgi:RNase P protein component
LRAAARELDRAPGGLAPGAYLVALRPEAARCSYQDLRRDLRDACASLTGTVPG